MQFDLVIDPIHYDSPPNPYFRNFWINSVPNRQKSKAFYPRRPSPSLKINIILQKKRWNIRKYLNKRKKELCIFVSVFFFLLTKDHPNNNFHSIVSSHSILAHLYFMRRKKLKKTTRVLWKIMFPLSKKQKMYDFWIVHCFNVE